MGAECSDTREPWHLGSIEHFESDQGATSSPGAAGGREGLRARLDRRGTAGVWRQEAHGQDRAAALRNCPPYLAFVIRLDGFAPGGHRGLLEFRP